MHRAITKILEAIWEQDFLEVSYGFRPGRSAHQALEQLDRIIMTEPIRAVVDMDIEKFFDTVDQEWLLECLKQRIAEPNLRRLIGRFFSQHFVSVKIMVEQTPALAQKFHVGWTPTLIVADSEAKEHYRFVGYLPPEEFVPQLAFGRAQVEFNRGHFEAAAYPYQDIVDSYPRAEVAPAAQYWVGVCRYKASGDFSQAKEAWSRLRANYPQSVWSQKVAFAFE